MHLQRVVILTYCLYHSIDYIQCTCLL